MATQFEIDTALMAGVAYRSTRSVDNRFPVPQGWNEVPLSHVALPSGFEAISFLSGNQVVISYAGTYDKDISGDVAADIGLATGYGSIQLLQAANYYLQVRATYPDPNVDITLTGHSLGGGLAALIGVFFGVRAYTFDQAPFANSAQSNSLLSNPLNILTPDVAANLRSDLLAMGYTESDLAGLTNFLQQREANGGIPNSNLVTAIRVDGEFLGALPYDPIGGPATTLTHGEYFGPLDLHSQALLTTFLQSPAFQEMTSRLPELLGMVFDSNLFAYTTAKTNTTDPNLLEHLIRHEVGGVGDVPVGGDAMLDRFTSDLDKLVVARGGTGGYRDLVKALVAFAMEKYYVETTDSPGYQKELFLAITGGLQFDTRDIAANITDAMIGYAGLGTVTEALLKGVPLLMIPATVEQYLLAKRVEAIGAGIVIEGASGQERIREGLAALLARAEYKSKALAFSAKYAMASVPRAAERVARIIIERLEGARGDGSVSGAQARPVRRENERAWG